VEFSAMRVSANLKTALKNGGIASEEYYARRAGGTAVLTILHPLAKTSLHSPERARND
jgi:hypothetical protein